MFISHIDSIESIPIAIEGLQGVSKQTLIDSVEGWKNHVMRLFTVEAGGHTPCHAHPWPHINYITKGNGTLFLSGKEYPLSPGSVAYIPSGEKHQFMNASQDDFSFICIVPKEGDK